MSQPPESLTADGASDVCLEVVERVEEAVVMDRDVLLEILAAIVARGHVLVEDVPGTGKTVLARVLAESLGLEFTRIQFTPDLLPADVTGSNVYDEHDRAFEFKEGPVFANVVLADEINRAPPKTQAALLESMEERQVSVDGETHPLPEPFVVVATQNPVEQEGTFQLPEAQRDRFAVKTSMGYPDVEGEMGLLERRANRRTLSPSVAPAVDPDTVVALQELAEDVRVDEKVRRYIVDLARETRDDDRTEIGVSPRGVQRVFETVRASAVMGGRTYATPDDVKRIATSTMTHRLVLTTEATVEGVDPADVVRDALDAVEVPAVSPNAPSPASPSGAAGADDGRSGATERGNGSPGDGTAGAGGSGTGGSGTSAVGSGSGLGGSEGNRPNGGGQGRNRPEGGGQGGSRPNGGEPGDETAGDRPAPDGDGRRDAPNGDGRRDASDDDGGRSLRGGRERTEGDADETDGDDDWPPTDG